MGHGAQDCGYETDSGLAHADWANADDLQHDGVEEATVKESDLGYDCSFAQEHDDVVVSANPNDHAAVENVSPNDCAEGVILNQSDCAEEASASPCGHVVEVENSSHPAHDHSDAGVSENRRGYARPPAMVGTENGAVVAYEAHRRGFGDHEVEDRAWVGYGFYSTFDTYRALHHGEEGEEAFVHDRDLRIPYRVQSPASYASDPLHDGASDPSLCALPPILLFAQPSSHALLRELRVLRRGAGVAPPVFRDRMHHLLRSLDEFQEHEPSYPSLSVSLQQWREYLMVLMTSHQ